MKVSKRSKNRPSGPPLRWRVFELAPVLALLAAGLIGAPAGAQDGGAVQVQSLAKLDLFSTGREVGLGQGLWKGSSADIARAVIPTLASHPLSPAGLALARRLLAQAAPAPDGAGSDADLAAARARVLLALGEPALADTILDHTPDLADNAALSQTAAEAALITGQDAKACAISEALSIGRDATYWLRLRAYCQLIAGKTDAAQLTFTLALQQGKDPIYARLMGVAINGAGDPGSASLRDGLDYALSRRLKLDLAPAIPAAPAAVAAQIAVTAPSPLTVPTPPGIAPAPPAEATVIVRLKAAKTFAAFLAATKAVRPDLAALVQAKVALTQPVLEASAALAAGDATNAATIRAGVPTGGDASLDLIILDAALAAAAGPPDGVLLDQLVARAAQSDLKSRAHAQAAAVLVAALDGPQSGGARAALMTFEIGHAEAGPARWLALQDAAAAGRVGEAGLIALSIAQTGGASGPATADRAQIIRALSLVGLKDDARAFAVEGLLSLGAR